jgi:hypothetical protein
MVDQRIGDDEAFKDYLHLVFARTEAWLADLNPRTGPRPRRPKGMTSEDIAGVPNRSATMAHTLGPRPM